MKTKFLNLIIAAIIGSSITLLVDKFFSNKNKSINQELTPNSKIYTVSQNRVPAELPDFVQAAENTVHAVVHVKTVFTKYASYYYTNPFSEFFGWDTPFRQVPQRIEATGSGVIISEDGYIITNNHVVDKADYIEVTLNDKRTYEATIVGTDPTTDLALLKINEKNLPYIRFGNSDEVKVGEWVLAVGNPFNLTSTVTAGIVSAKGRSLNILGGGTAIESYIQTDAAVNKGNSGGALVNTKGELIGINAAIASNTGSYSGYSFAIPVSIVKKVAEDLLEFGQVQRAFLGVNIRNIDSKLAEEKNISQLNGVYVDGLTEKSAAAESGIKQGDIIISINGITVNNIPELQEQIARYRPGDKVSVGIIRNNENKIVTVTLKNKDGNTELVKRSKEELVSALGAVFVIPDKSELDKLGLTHGIQVKKLEGGILKSVGIREGFIITKIDNKPIYSVEELVNCMKNKRGGILIEGMYPNGLRAYYGMGL